MNISHPEGIAQERIEANRKHVFIHQTDSLQISYVYKYQEIYTSLSLSLSLPIYMYIYIYTYIIVIFVAVNALIMFNKTKKKK